MLSANAIKPNLDEKQLDAAIVELKAEINKPRTRYAKTVFWPGWAQQERDLKLNLQDYKNKKIYYDVLRYYWLNTNGALIYRKQESLAKLLEQIYAEQNKGLEVVSQAEVTVARAPILRMSTATKPIKSKFVDPVLLLSAQSREIKPDVKTTHSREFANVDFKHQVRSGPLTLEARTEQLELQVKQLLITVEKLSADNQQFIQLRNALERIIQKDLLLEQKSEKHQQEMIRINSSEPLLDFYNSLKEKLGTKLCAFQVLRSELISHTAAANNFISFFTSLAASSVPLVGAAVDKAVNFAYSAHEIKKMKAVNLLLGDIVETCKIVEEFARRLTLGFAVQLNLLTADGARAAAKEYVADLVIAALKEPGKIPAFGSLDDKLEKMYDCVTQHKGKFYNVKNKSLESEVLQDVTAQGLFMRCAIGVNKGKVGNETQASLERKFKGEKIVIIHDTVWSILIDGKKTADAKHGVQYKYQCREPLYAKEVEKLKLIMQAENKHDVSPTLKKQNNHRRNDASMYSPHSLASDSSVLIVTELDSSVSSVRSPSNSFSETYSDSPVAGSVRSSSRSVLERRTDSAAAPVSVNDVMTPTRRATVSGSSAGVASVPVNVSPIVQINTNVPAISEMTLPREVNSNNRWASPRYFGFGQPTKPTKSMDPVTALSRMQLGTKYK